MSKFDIIILQWNVSEKTVKCLKSIEKYSEDYRVIFVDNGSEDSHLVRAVEELVKLPNVLICNEENLGFVKGVNQGIERVEAPYTILMNNDTEAVPGWLDKLVEPFENEKIIATGPRTNAKNSWQGNWTGTDGILVLPRSAMLAFFCTMFRSSVWKEIGLLNEIFGIGFGDDDDYCERIHNAGYDIALVQDLVIPHDHRSTFKAHFEAKQIAEMQKKNLDIFKKLHNKND